MDSQTLGRYGAKWEDHLVGLSALVAVGCLAYIWQHPHSYPESVWEVIVPFGLAFGLAIYTRVLKYRNAPSAQSRLMVKYGLVGALFAGAIGSAELAFHLYSGLPIDVFPDKILTFVSIGLVSGVVAGKVSADTRQARREPDRERVLAETSWTHRPEESPIVAAVADALAEVEGVDPVEIDPIYTHVDPEVFANLQAHDGSPYQITVYTDDYEIRISSHGTVTVYRPHLVESEPAARSPSLR